MKIKSLLLGATGLGLGLSAQAQTTVDIAGATAFRAAAHQSIMASFTKLDGYAHDGAAGEGAKANRATYKGNFPGITGTTVIRVNWTGSVEGVRSLASSNATADSFIPVTSVKTGESAGVTAKVDSKTAAMAFSDVTQSNTPYKKPALEGGPVGVIAFAPVINKGAPAAIQNITTNHFRRLATAGTIKASMLTGNAIDTGNIYLMGRNDGSGTRVSFLSEIGFGAANGVKQYVIDATNSATSLATPILAPTTVDSTKYPKYSLSTDFTKSIVAGNGGYSSGSAIAGWMKLPSSGNFNIVSWVGTPDAISAANAVNGKATGGRVLAYNGEILVGVANGAWTEADRNKIRLGKYAAWNFENLYTKPILNAAETTVYKKLKATIPANLGSAGVAIDSKFRVARTTDGGVIAPK
jgi:hypothetical protein